MLRNYLIVATRNLQRRRLYTGINVAGLSVGIAFCILSLLFVTHELSHDHFHEDAGRIFMAFWDHPDARSGSTPPVLAKALRQSIPGVEQVVRVHGWTLERTPVKRGDVRHYMQLLMVDPAFLDVFSFPEVAGRLDGALDDPSSVVIGDRLARTLFGDENPIGQRLSVNGGRETDGFVDFTVAAVTRVPDRSSLRFDLLLSHELRRGAFDQWGGNHVLTFVRLRPGVDPVAIETHFASFADAHFAEDRAAGRSYPGGQDQRLRALPLTDLYLGARVQPTFTRHGSRTYVAVLSGLGVSVLLIACINFMNLSLGLATARLREVGVRKALGAVRGQLRAQFVGEALLISALSLGAGVGLAELCRPLFSDLVQRSLAIDYGRLWPTLTAIGLCVGLVTGLYPASLLSRLRPVAALHGSARLGGVGWLGRVLVTVQMSLSVALIAACLVMVRQLAHLHDIDLGFDAEQVVVIDMESGLDRQARLHLAKQYRQLGESLPTVVSVTATNMSFGDGDIWGTTWRDAADERQKRIDTYTVDYGYPATLGIPLVVGRDFSPDHPTDEKDAVLVNEALVRFFGLEQPIGQRIPDTRHTFLRGSIIGVLADTHVQPLRHAIEPAVYRLRTGNAGLRSVLVRISPAGMRETLDRLEETWRREAPDLPFTYTFLDQDVARSFAEDERRMQVARYSAVFAALLACLGAFGLTSLAVARRTREVGLRKALGATVTGVTALLSRDFALLVAAGGFVAGPLSAVAMKHWLDEFAYRIDLTPLPLLLATAITLCVVLTAVGAQTLRAALANPVEALRYE